MSRPRSSLWLLAIVVVLCIGSACALKQLPVNTVFSQVVQDAISCEIGTSAVLNLNRQVQAKREELERKRLHVREDDILSIMEHLCDPFAEGGEWIRQVALHVERESDEASPVAEKGPVLTLRVMPYYTVCKRTCATVRSLCENFLDSSEADDLSAIVLHSLTRFDDLNSQPAKKAVLDQVCYGAPRCVQLKANHERLRRVFSTAGDTTLEDVDADVPEKVSDDEMQMEEMMAGTFAKNGQKASVFARDEVQKLHHAIAQGDRELAESLDPSMKTMSPGEFEELQSIFALESPFAGEDPDMLDGDL